MEISDGALRDGSGSISAMDDLKDSGVAIAAGATGTFLMLSCRRFLHALCTLNFNFSHSSSSPGKVLLKDVPLSLFD